MSERVARRWSSRRTDPSCVDQLVAEAGCSPRVARLLVARGVDHPEAAADFLEPGWGQLHDPMALAGMEAACGHVHRAIADGERITLYGDYDVDGTCATALLWWAFKKLGADVRYHVPDRRDGYGLTEAGIEATRAAGSTFLVTMDQGISARREIAMARELGIRVLVTDHHAPPAELPDAVAILHPGLGGAYPNPHLCGAGVAFKFGEALLATAANPALRESARAYREACVDLAAIATIADVSPLVGENRALVALGLEQMGRTRHPGLKAMLEESGRGKGGPSAEDVAFGVAPMMNASGRLAGPELTLQCLIARSRSEARDLARQLGRLNQRRRDLTEELMDEALEQRAAWADEKIGVLRLDSEAAGIVGLVAGRLREMYWKPFVVLARKGDELVGSCRSVEGFDVQAALDTVGDELSRHGGHAQAAGLTMDPARFEAFAGRLREHVRATLDEDLLVPRLAVDEVVSLEDLHWGLLDEVRCLEPFGAGNPAPVFVLEGCEVERTRTMGRQGKHVRLEARGFPEFLDTVGFHLRGVADRCLEHGRSMDMAFQVSRNEWQGRARLQLRLEDLRPPQA